MADQYRVKIGNKDYVLTSSVAKKDILLAVELLNEDWQTIQQKSPQLTEEQVAVLAAMEAKLQQISLARRSLQLEQVINQLEQQIEADKQQETLVLQQQLKQRIDDYLKQKHSKQEWAAAHQILNAISKETIQRNKQL